MKYYIDMVNCASHVNQLMAVKKYIDEYGHKETPKNTGCRVETKYGNFHVSCRKTKKGDYSFKIWLAI